LRMETSGPKQYLGFGIAPPAGRETRDCPRISLALSAEPLTKLPLFKQRKNLIQQDAEKCQQKKSSPSPQATPIPATGIPNNAEGEFVPGPLRSPALFALRIFLGSAHQAGRPKSRTIRTASRLARRKSAPPEPLSRCREGGTKRLFPAIFLGLKCVFCSPNTVCFELLKKPTPLISVSS